MPTTSASSARRRFLHSLPWLALSLSALLRGAGDLRAARAAEPTRRAELLRLRALVSEMEAMGPADATASDLPTALARLVDALQRSDARYGVRLGMVALPGRSGGLPDGPADAQAIAALAQALPGALGLRRVRVDVRAGYRSYEGLKAWFGELEALPLSFQQVLLDQAQVQFSASVFGT